LCCVSLYMRPETFGTTLVCQYCVLHSYAVVTHDKNDKIFAFDHESLHMFRSLKQWCCSVWSVHLSVHW